MAANINDALKVLTPTAQWSLTNVNDYSTLQWHSPSIPQPTQAQVEAEQATLDAQAPLTACTNQASSLLSQTDWTSIPDVANPAVSNPYLMNQSEFLAYRSTVRNLAVNPVANPVFPPLPTQKWSS